MARYDEEEAAVDQEEAAVDQDQPFSVRMRGYDRDEVDLYISQLFKELDAASAEVEELRRSRPANPEEVIGQEVERVLREARQIATSVSGDAEQQASGLIDKAREESRRKLGEAQGKLDGAQRKADRVLAEARSEAEKLLAEARSKADKKLAQARSEAERVIAESRTRLEAMQKAEKELAARLDESVKATQAVLKNIEKNQPAAPRTSVGAGPPAGPKQPQAQTVRTSETAPIDLTRGQEDAAGRKP